MKQVLTRLCFWLCVFALLTVAPQGAFAQDYPTKPIRLLVPYSAGGASDIMARTIAQQLAENLGQQVVVENRLGAGGDIAADAVAKAEPNGYTLLFGATGPLAINPSLKGKLPYDPLKDFAPIGLVGIVPVVMVVPVSLPVYSIKDLIALAKSKPGQLNYGSAGVGGATHLTMEMFKSRAGIDIVHVPYKGNAAVVVDLIAGNVHAMLDGWATTEPYVKSGKLRFLGVATSSRSPSNPQVPTIAESGFPGFEGAPWYGLLAPAGTPREIINKLSTELAKVMTLPKIRERFVSLRMDPLTSSPEQFETYIRSENIKWAKIVRDSGAKAD